MDRSPAVDPEALDEDDATILGLVQPDTRGED
jgi:hypothetical protein